VRPGTNVQEYIDNDLDSELNGIYQRLDDLEDNTPEDTLIKIVRIEYDLCCDDTYDDIRESYESGHLVTYRYENENDTVYITTNAIINYEEEYVHVFFPDYEFRLLKDGGAWEEV
jgi:neutral trehalase